MRVRFPYRTRTLTKDVRYRNRTDWTIMAQPEDDTLDKLVLTAGQEALTPEEKEAFLARARSEGRSLTSEEQYAIFGPPADKVENFRKGAKIDESTIEEMEPVWLDSVQISQLQNNFFPELGNGNGADDLRLIHGVIFDFDYTLAHLSQPLDELMAAGARDAEAYMRSTGMELPENFAKSIVEARRFSEEKSEEEKEEHLADDAMSFLLQFFGYPASRMDPEVLKRTVDIFYAREMVAWKLLPGALDMLKALNAQGYKLAVLANYNCDRVFQRIIDYLGIRPYLDLCIASASVEFRKPDEKLFQIVLDRWDALPYEVVVVGDSLLHDIQGGIDLGALTVQVQIDSPAQVRHDNTQFVTQIKPDAVIDNLAILVNQIQLWAKI